DQVKLNELGKKKHKAADKYSRKPSFSNLHKKVANKNRFEYFLRYHKWEYDY
ncbi:unnamed protein product, partial [marine sediment metagenome]